MAAALLILGWGGARSEAAAPVAGEPDVDRVVARVNQAEITYGTFKIRLEEIQQERGPIPAERQGELLKALVREEVLFQEATAGQLELDAAVKARVEVARRQVLVQELLRRQVKKLGQVTDEDVRKMYDENKPLFTAETVGASHIMVKTETEAEAILKDLQAGKDFAETAKARSEDTGSAEKGGDLGELRHGQTVQEFEEEAFRLKEGELSPVIKTQYGYHILKGGAHASSVEPFDEVKGKIRQSLLQQKQQDSFMTFMADLEKKAKTEIFEDQLK